MSAAGLRRRVALAAGRHLPRRTVRVRLTLLYGALFLVSGVALVGVTYGLFERATAYTRPQLPHVPHTPAVQGLHPALNAFLSQPPPGQALSSLPQLVRVQRQLAQDQYQLGLAVPKAAALPGHPLTQALFPLARDQRQLVRDQHQLAAAVGQLAQAVHQMARAGSVQAAQRAADSHQLLVNAGTALAIVAVLALLAGWLVAGRMLRPLRTITRRAQRLSSASLHERLALDGPQDELKELGDTLDDLLGRLDAAFAAQRQFVANASHELRAPLTRQRALIQVALADPDASFASLRAAHERVLASEQHLEQMLDGLLTLTRGQAGVERREPLDLAALAAQVLRARGADTDLGLDVHATLAPAPTVGDPRLLERLLANLLDNAVRYNTPAGHVAIATGTRHHQVFLTVANSGPTIPPEELPRLLQPFQRLHGTRTTHGSGNGLGLAIVSAIAAAHRAALSTRPRAGGGLVVEVAFPAAAHEAERAVATQPALESCGGAVLEQ